VEAEVVEAEVVEAEAVETEAEEVEAHAVETEEAEEVEAYAVETQIEESVSTIDKANEVDTALLTKNTIVKNQTIAGDFFVSNTVCEGKVYFDNVTIKGNLIIEGSGEDSIYMRNVKIEGKFIVNKAGVSVMVSRETVIPTIEVLQYCTLSARRLTGEVGTVIFKTQLVATQTTLDLDVEKIEVAAPIDVVVAQYVNTLHVKNVGEGTKLTTERNTKIANLIAEGKMNISGEGEIGTLVVNANGVTVGSCMEDDDIADIENDMELEEERDTQPLTLTEIPEETSDFQEDPLAKILTYIGEIGKNKTSKSQLVKNIVEEILGQIEDLAKNRVVPEENLAVAEIPKEQPEPIQPEPIQPVQEIDVLDRREIDKIKMEAMKELEEIKLEAIAELKELKELKKLKATMVEVAVEKVETVAEVEEVVEEVETEAVVEAEEIVEEVVTEAVAEPEEIVEEVEAEAVVEVEEVVEEVVTEAVAEPEETVEEVETEAVVEAEEIVEEVEAEAVVEVEEIVEEVVTEAVAEAEEVVEEVEAEVEEVATETVAENEEVERVSSLYKIKFDSTIDETKKELQVLTDDENGVQLTLQGTKTTAPVEWSIASDGEDAFALITDESNPKTAILGVMANVAKAGSTATIVAKWTEEATTEIAELTVTAVVPPVNTALRLQEALQNHDGVSPIVLLKSTKGPVTAEYKGTGELVIDTNRRSIRGNMKITAKKIERFVLDGNVRGDVVLYIPSAKNVTINGKIDGTITIHETANAEVEINLETATKMVAVGKSRIANIVAPMAEVLITGTIDTVNIQKAKGIHASGMVNLLEIHERGDGNIPFTLAGHGVAIAKIVSAVPLGIKDDLQEVQIVSEDFESTMEIAVQDGIEIEKIEANTNVHIVGVDGVNVGNVRNISLVVPKDLPEEQKLTVRTKADANDRDIPPAIFVVDGEIQQTLAYDKDDISLYVNKKLKRPTYTVQYAEDGEMIVPEKTGAGEVVIPLETTVEVLFEGLREGTSLYYTKSHEPPIAFEIEDDFDIDFDMNMDMEEVKMKDVIRSAEAIEISFSEVQAPLVFTMGTIVTAMIAQSGLQKNKATAVDETIGAPSDVEKLKITMDCIDKTKLQSLIEFVQTVDQREYTADTWKLFVEAMRTACALVETETETELTQQAIDRAVEELQFAYEVLIEKPTAPPPKVTFLGAKMLKEATWKYVSEIGEAVSFAVEPIAGVTYSYEILVGTHVKKSSVIKNSSPIHVTFGSEKNEISYNVNIKASNGTLRDSIVMYQIQVLHSLEGLEIVGVDPEMDRNTAVEGEKTAKIAPSEPKEVAELEIPSLIPVTPRNQRVTDHLNMAVDQNALGSDERMKMQAAYLQSIVAAEGM
ncbi:MAG: hypothetical protein R3Y53_08225, partial [Bacillota bacterium]